jgi:hypothetical protein
MRTKKTGFALEMYVNEQCVRHLLMLPDPAARKAVVEFLAARVVPAVAPAIEAAKAPTQGELDLA